MPHLICGGIGGIISVLAVLIVSNGEPLAGYVANLGVPPAGQLLVGYTVKVMGLFLLGGFWVWLNRETNRLKAFQLGIAAPAVITGMIATYQTKEAAAPTPPSSQGSSFLFSSAYAQDSLKNEAAAESSIFGNIIGGILNEPITATLPVERLPERFSGADRRIASDRLIQLYDSNKDQVVKSVVDALQKDGDNYRINIYVARTLGLIPGGWEGTVSQKEAVESLRSTRSYQDKTFKENVDRAIANWRLKAS